MSTLDVVKAKFEQLMDFGMGAIASCQWDGHQYQKTPSVDVYLRFRTEAMNLVKRVCGPTSDHYFALKQKADDVQSTNNGFFLIHCLAIVDAAKRDFEAGLLFDMRSLIAAELLGDFIEQAETLLQAGYHVPAASLAGAVLEDTLRKLCEKNSVPLPASTTINSLNSELARANVYDKLILKRITALADVRNNADHGHWDKFKRDDVEDMVKWIRNFAADYLK